MIEITRRTFIRGLGAVIVASALPIASISSAPAREMPRIVLTVADQGPFTASYLAACLRDIGKQVAAMEHLRPTQNEKAAIIENIEQVLSEIRPIGLLVEVKTSYEKLMAGEFVFRERPMGIVEIT